MRVSITAFYAAILAILTTALAINVTLHRVKLKVPIGDGGSPRMLRMIRLHGNCVEYVPLTLLLMLAYEIDKGAPVILHIVGITMILGRALHAWGLWGAALTFRRVAGQTLTWATIVALAVLNIVQIV
jgi:hypothetical protein